MGYTNVTVNQGTNTAIYTDNTGGTGGSQIGVVKLDISPQGTAGTLWGGNVGVSSGTINSLPNIPGGTIGSVVGVGAIPNIPGGTIGSVVGVGVGVLVSNSVAAVWTSMVGVVWGTVLSVVCIVARVGARTIDSSGFFFVSLLIISCE